MNMRARTYVNVYIHRDNIEGLRNFPCIVANPTSGAEHISRFVIFHVAHDWRTDSDLYVEYGDGKP